MAIEKDKTHKTAIEVTYARTGNTIHRRERHGVKDETNTVRITLDETTDYKGSDAVDYYKQLKAFTESKQTSFDALKASNQAVEADMQSELDFMNDQIAEIEALL